MAARPVGIATLPHCIQRHVLPVITATTQMAMVEAVVEMMIDIRKRILLVCLKCEFHPVKL